MLSEHVHVYPAILKASVAFNEPTGGLKFPILMPYLLTYAAHQVPLLVVEPYVLTIRALVRRNSRPKHPKTGNVAL